MKNIFKTLILSAALAVSSLAWDDASLDAIDRADDLKIAPVRANGVTGTPTWIWEVVVENRLFVRPYNGKNSSWYRSAVAFGEGIIVAAGATRKVRFAPAPDAALNAKIDEAYKAKYAKSPYLRHMISGECRETTIEIIEK